MLFFVMVSLMVGSEYYFDAPTWEESDARWFKMQALEAKLTEALTYTYGCPHPYAPHDGPGPCVDCGMQ